MSDIHWEAPSVDSGRKWALNGHLPCVVWLTGLSASGKSTIARALDLKLFELGSRSYVLDGDNLRHGLCADFGFSQKDRERHVGRVAEVAKLMADAGQVVIVALISPSRAARNRARASVPRGLFMEVHVETPLAVCEQRDPKGLYKKARAGELPEFTGIGSPYEPPSSPDLRLDTSVYTVDECVAILTNLLSMRGAVPHRTSREPVPERVNHATAME